MSWIASLLIGVGIADLIHSVSPVKVLQESLGAAGVDALGVFCGLKELRDVLALAR